MRIAEALAYWGRKRGAEVTTYLMTETLRPITGPTEIFDVAGRSVSVLEDGYREAGTHSVSWNGTGTGGGTAASGIYFMRLTVGSRSFSRKIVLLK
jgi:flagellar hook assembly protein FlgD